MKKKPALTEKKQMQNVNFSSVDECLDFLPEDELKIVEALRQLVFDCIPDCKEKLFYNVPSYRRHASICFIWPGSISWGGVHQKGVRLGFSYGYLLEDEISFLDKGNRKQVYWHDFFDIKDIDTELVSSYLYQAALIDEEKAKEKKLMKKQA